MLLVVDKHKKIGSWLACRGVVPICSAPPSRLFAVFPNSSWACLWSLGFGAVFGDEEIPVDGNRFYHKGGYLHGVLFEGTLLGGFELGSLF